MTSEVDYNHVLTSKANAGDSEAMFQLGVSCAFGRGVELDLEKALYWLKKAAKAGHTMAGLVLQDIGQPLTVSAEESNNVVAKKEFSTGDTKTIVLPGGEEMEMIYCAPGSFIMGSPASEPGRYDSEVQHKVTLTKGFWLGKYPVTQSQWESVMGNNPFQSNKGYNYPVDNVSWDDCNDFIEKINSQSNINARFPTEAEWEYACRAGTTTAYYWGNYLNGDMANCNGNYPCGTNMKGHYVGKTTMVGSYYANPWGFYDMHGNVCEWCADWLGSYPTNAVTDPKGPASGDYYRVLRGGGWSNLARRCRSADRSNGYPGERYFYFGFRLCCSAGPHE